MFGKKLWVLVSMMALLAGCGGGAAAQKGGNAAYAGGGAAKSAPTEQAGYPSSSTGADEASVAPSPASPPADFAAGGGAPSAAPRGEARSAERSAEPAPTSRPGLGTEWGESRTSRVHDVTFVRDSSRPFAVASLNYNDRRGVEAMASREANRDTFRSIETGGGAVSVSIRDDGGNPLEAMRVGGKTFVIGQAGQRYSIVLSNHTSHRFEAVATVDGLDVINGKDGSFDNRGYVLLPFATLEIEGFRQSSAQVASFRFASVADSYAAQMGKARNVGVIGVAFFAERGDAFVPENELRTRETASPFPADPRFAPPPPRR
jgi:hypothetical protein